MSTTFQLTQIPNWVLWNLEKRAGKETKVPYTTIMNSASSTNSTTWDTYQNAIAAKQFYQCSGIGCVLPLEETVLGIDLDKVIEDGKLTKYNDVVEQADTYTEYSPSGTGLHLFLHIPEGLKLESHRSKKAPGFECYTSGRYFTYTGNAYMDKPIRTVSAEQAVEILTLAGYPWAFNNKNIKENGGTSIIDDDEVIRRMFNSKNGSKIQALYNGDTSDYNEDTSSADMGLCMHLAFWTQKDADAIERIWMKSPLGNREKTQTRGEDYRKDTISKAIGATTDIYSPTDKDNIVATLNLMVSSKNIPFQNIENIQRIIASDELLKDSLRYNEFTLEEETNLGTQYNDRDWHSLQKEDIAFITCHIQRNYPFFERVQKQNVEDAVLVYAQKHIVNPVKDWIENIEWDGHYRLDHWISRVYYTPDDAYHSAVGANWFKGLVKRIIHPGAKFDHLLILEGPQGYKKSSSLITLGKGYHVETILSPDNKDFQMILKKNIIVEFSEGHTMNRADSRLLKSIISSQEDQFRAPFGRAVQNVRRRCVFAMTTNENQYLRDETGNRRFLPVEVKNVADIEWLEQNVDQLYAEAYQRVILDKESYWEFPEETQEIQESKMVENAYADALIEWYASLSEDERQHGITALQAYQQVWLGGSPLGREMTPMNVMMVTGQLSHTLKMFKKIKMIDGKRANRWFPSEDTYRIIGNASAGTNMEQEAEKAFKNF